VQLELDRRPPDLSKISVKDNGQLVSVTGSGFKRRPFSAAFARRDLRIANCLYLQLSSPIASNDNRYSN